MAVLEDAVMWANLACLLQCGVTSLSVLPFDHSCTHCCLNLMCVVLVPCCQVGKWGLSTHGPHGNALIDNSWQKPLAGLCCNHYQVCCVRVRVRMCVCVCV